MDNKIVYVMFRDGEAGHVPDALADRIKNFEDAERAGDPEQTELGNDMYALPVRIPSHVTTKFMAACRGDDCYSVSLDKP